MTSDSRMRFTLRLPKVLDSMLKEEAVKKGLTKNAVISGILWDYYENESVPSEKESTQTTA